MHATGRGWQTRTNDGLRVAEHCLGRRLMTIARTTSRMACRA
ncbi:hypothetical protein ACVCMJ_14640 [Castellaniella sp. UC4447_H14]